MKKANFFILILITLSGLTTLSAAGKAKTSGKIEDGLRYLRIDSSRKDLSFTIYRGDYIVFDFAKKGSYDFRVTGLDIDTVMPRPQGEKAYVKMKKSGTYDFILGSRRGTFTVLELVDPHYEELTAAEADSLIKNSRPYILDVRTSGEFRSARIEDAENIPVQVLSQQMGKIMNHKDEPVLVYCASGNRSTVAARVLMQAGFTKVYNLRYGIGDWYRKGFPVEQ